MTAIPKLSPWDMNARARRDARIKERRAGARAQTRQRNDRRSEGRVDAYHRDGGRCRCCRKTVALKGSNPFRLANGHHHTYASKQGADDESNRVTLCAECHQKVHDGLMEVLGDPRSVLKFRIYVRHVAGGPRTFVRQVVSALKAA